MGLSIDGLSSGLDTTSLINPLMTSKRSRRPSSRASPPTSSPAFRRSRASTASVADLATKAARPRQPEALDLYAATSSSAKVTATTTARAPAAGSLDFTVDPAGPVPGLGEPRTLTGLALHHHDHHTAGGKSRHRSRRASTSLDDVVSAVNARRRRRHGQQGLRRAAASSGCSSPPRTTGAAGAIHHQLIRTARDGLDHCQGSRRTPRSSSGRAPRLEQTDHLLHEHVHQAPPRRLRDGVRVSATPVTVTVARDAAQITSRPRTWLAPSTASWPRSPPRAPWWPARTPR